MPQRRGRRSDCTAIGDQGTVFGSMGRFINRITLNVKLISKVLPTTFVCAILGACRDILHQGVTLLYFFKSNATRPGT